MENQDKVHLNLNVGGLQLPLVVTENDAQLLTQAASYVNTQINERRQKSAIAKPLDVTAIMVALSTASELINAQNKLEQGIQEQISPHLEMLRGEINHLNDYADSIINQLDIR